MRKGGTHQGVAEEKNIIIHRTAYFRTNVFLQIL